MQFAKIILDRRIDGERPDGHPCHKHLPIDVQKDGTDIRIIQCSFLSDGAGCSLIRFKDPQGKYKSKLGEGLGSSHLGEHSVAKISETDYLIMVLNNNCRLAQILSQSGAILSEAVPRDDYIIEWSLLAPTKGILTQLFTRMRNEGYGVEVVRSSSMKAESTLTPKQSEVLQYAYTTGYYDIPRRINVEGLADHFECTKSTMSVILRNAEKKIIAMHLNVNRNGTSME